MYDEDEDDPMQISNIVGQCIILGFIALIILGIVGFVDNQRHGNGKMDSDGCFYKGDRLECPNPKYNNRN